MTPPRDRPRVLHVSQPVDAGVAVVVADLVEHQCSLGWDVHLACPPSGWLLGRLAHAPVTVHAWPAGRTPGPSVAREARALAAIVRTAAPDVVHLHSAKAGLAGRLAVRGRVPTVFQPHAWSFHAAAGPVQAASTAWERWAMRWTHLLIAVSRAELAEGTKRGIAAPHSEVVSNGVDVRYFTPGDRSAARERLGLGRHPLAVVLGRLARQKGQDLAIAAWPGIRALAPDARLAIVGDGPDRAHLATSLPAGVTLHGAVADPRDWLAAADVVLLPSRWEGMALVPLEAMASARSVVGFDVAGVAESIGDAGATVPAGDLDALADAVAERLGDAGLTEREGKRGRARAEELFDRAETLARTSSATASLAATAESPAAGT
jgi:glycosyltransferase involved in cell wall biosynthesis